MSVIPKKIANIYVKAMVKAKTIKMWPGGQGLGLASKTISLVLGLADMTSALYTVYQKSKLFDV